MWNKFATRDVSLITAEGGRYGAHGNENTTVCNLEPTDFCIVTCIGCYVYCTALPKRVD